MGDLVRMKYIVFWMFKNQRHKTYTEQPLLVMEMAHNAIKVMYPDGRIKSCLAEHYEVINEC